MKKSIRKIALRAMIAIPVLIAMGSLQGCEQQTASDLMLQNSTAEEGITAVNLQPTFDVELWDAGTLIYKESTGFGLLQMQTGKTYDLKINSSTPGITLTMTVIGGSGATALEVGDNSVTAGSVGNPIYRIVADAPGDSTRVKDYDVGIYCSSAQIAGFAVNANDIQVSSLATNLYAYSAAGIASGSTNYECAYDFNGDGIRDSDYGSCSQAVTAYSNYVDQRKIGVFVRDVTCNKVLLATATKTLTAPATSSLAAPTIFIAGNISGNASDPRVNLRHVSTNPNAQNAKVQCEYDQNGVFKVSGLNQYGLTSSVNHGLQVSFSGMTDNINYATSSGTINTSNAKIEQVIFQTDQDPDAQAALTFSGGSNQCTGTISAVVKNVSGSPCSGSGGHVNGGYTIAAQGTFACTGLPADTAASQTINIQNGKFYCEYQFADQCSGGGGGGGGVPPIQF